MSVDTLTRALPAPIYNPGDREVATITHDVMAMAVAPPYGQRKGWIPRKPEDFGDGGAYPEIPAAQYPLGMGLKNSGDSKVLAKTLDAEGTVQYDAIARYGQRSDKIIHSKISNQSGRLVDLDDEALKKPDLEELKEVTERTKQALEKLVASKITAAMPVTHADKKQPAQYIRYTPSQQGAAFNSGAKQSIIRMVDIQKDPMEPPRFKTNKKIPRGPPSPPAPVLHSPNRKVTVKEQQEWKIPPCISNWKNAKGFTIPLDKRLAADGRGLQQVHINENFAKLAESLYIADRKAREAVEARAQLEKKVAQKEKEHKEEQLRLIANKAREERAGLHRNQQQPIDEELQERDELRRDKNKERQRERNINRAAPDTRKRLNRENERDISEKIALGLPNNNPSSTNQFDQRLFNQTRGMDSGFGGGDDESYNVYDAAWRDTDASGLAQAVYRPSKNAQQQHQNFEAIANDARFVSEKASFSGADSSATARRGEAPVQFEKAEDDDLFGLNKFLDAAKRATKRSGGHQQQQPTDSGQHHKRRKD